MIGFPLKCCWSHGEHIQFLREDFEALGVLLGRHHSTAQPCGVVALGWLASSLPSLIHEVEMGGAHLGRQEVGAGLDPALVWKNPWLCSAVRAAPSKMAPVTIPPSGGMGLQGMPPGEGTLWVPRKLAPVTCTCNRGELTFPPLHVCTLPWMTLAILYNIMYHNTKGVYGSCWFQKVLVPRRTLSLNPRALRGKTDEGLMENIFFF